MVKILNQYHRIKKYLKHVNGITESFQFQKENNLGKSIHHYNWWPDDSHSRWLSDFINNRGIMKNPSKTLALCSVFDEIEILEQVDTDFRVFFSGENLHNPRHAQYADYMLSRKKPFDIALGFDYFEHKKYLRFPLWLTYMFAPNATENEIRNRCNELRYPRIDKKLKFASLIARYDWNGIRGEMAELLKTIEKVDCPSALLHNDDTLHSQFNDDKTAYLMQYKFNICPENTNSYGYVTEKIFEAISSGCIPIYWGSYNKPELDILNQDAILFWDKDGENDDLIMFISEMYNNESRYVEFASQPRLIDNAEDKILQYFSELENKLKSVIC